MAGYVIDRNEFFVRFSEAFAPGEIVNTRTRLEPYDPRLDHLDMLRKLGLLFFLGPTETEFKTYRERLGIPRLNQAIITQVMHFCLQHQPAPLPMQVSVIEGASEQVEVTVKPNLVYLVIVRTRFEGSRRRSRASVPAAGRSASRRRVGSSSGSSTVS